jgi:hypothetical protein
MDGRLVRAVDQTTKQVVTHSPGVLAAGEVAKTLANKAAQGAAEGAAPTVNDSVNRGAEQANRVVHKGAEEIKDTLHSEGQDLKTVVDDTLKRVTMIMCLFFGGVTITGVLLIDRQANDPQSEPHRQPSFRATKDDSSRISEVTFRRQSSIRKSWLKAYGARFLVLVKREFVSSGDLFNDQQKARRSLLEAAD